MIKLVSPFVCVALTLAAAACASHQPGDPQHAWVNGTWNGMGQNWEQTFWLEVVDGNKVIGRQQSCMIASGGCGEGPLEGEIVGNTIKVKVWKSRLYEYTIVRTKDGNLLNLGVVLRKIS